VRVIRYSDGWLVSNAYFDDCYGRCFHYDVWIPKDGGEVRIDGMSLDEVEKEIEEVAQETIRQIMERFRISRQDAEDILSYCLSDGSVFISIPEHLEDRLDEIVSDLPDTVADLWYLETIRDLLEYWENVSEEWLEENSVDADNPAE